MFHLSDFRFKIESAVFPIAGLGTRILPATKAMPKEMLTVVDKPLIEYAVDEARSIGVRKFIFVVHPDRMQVQRHFSKNKELEQALLQQGKQAEFDRIKQSTLPSEQMRFPVQEEPLGLGHAVWCARKHVGDGAFAVILPDDLVLGERSCIRQMAEARNEVGGNILATEKVPIKAISRYGSLAPGKRNGSIYEVLDLVEKPQPEHAPSDLAVIGRYILSPTVFKFLAQHNRGAGNEIQLTDAMRKMLTGEPFHAVEFEGRRYDCGNKAGYVAANLAYGLADEALADELRPLIREIVGDED